MFGGIGAREVATMPGAAGPASSLGCVGRCGDGVTVVAASSLRVAKPLLVRTQPDASGAITHSSTNIVRQNRFTSPSSVFGEGLREFSFYVEVRRAGNVDDNSTTIHTRRARSHFTLQQLTLLATATHHQQQTNPYTPDDARATHHPTTTRPLTLTPSSSHTPKTWLPAQIRQTTT